MRFKKKEHMTEDEFLAKYYIPTPSDSRERDLILMGCLRLRHLRRYGLLKRHPAPKQYRNAAS